MKSDSMFYMGFDAPGAPDVFIRKTRQKPPISADDILISVKAAGVNYPDIMQRQGRYPPPLGASDILGLEVAGIVADVGENITNWRVGDAVCALTNGGGYAEYVAVPAGQCLPIPPGLSLIEAASLPENFFTVWYNVFERGHLKSGDTFLVHGGAGGIGSTAIQLGCAFGATVFTTCSGGEKADFCRALGAHHIISYSDEDFVERVRQDTNNQGVDIILDAIGGDYFAKNISVLKMDGRLIQISSRKGHLVTLDLGQLMKKRLFVTGSTLRPLPAVKKAAITQSLLQHVWPLFSDKTMNSRSIKPIVTQVFSFDDVARAHALIEAGRHIGKIVLCPDAS